LSDDIRQIAAAQVEVLADVIVGLTDADLVAPTRCAGWLGAHLLTHIRLGLAEHATSFAEPADDGEPVDRDYVTYWRDWPAGTAPVTYEQVRFHWATGSAYVTGESMRRHVADTARQAAGLSRQAPDGTFRFQGHVMAAADILAMWTVEWVIHQLDLTAYLPGSRPGPRPGALDLTARTLDGLLETSARPQEWDDATYVLKGTGRIPLYDIDREYLGDRAIAYPAFG
jgi:Mycothiol maleylpyruvate isomerase N-terminal domain